MLARLINLQTRVDLHFWISIIFLCLILIPVIILFISFYQNLLETVKTSKNTMQRASQQSAARKTSQQKAAKRMAGSKQNPRQRKINSNNHYAGSKQSKSKYKVAK